MPENPNISAAARALRGLRISSDENDLETRIADTLANLRHLCDAHELEFWELDNRARFLYLGDGESEAAAPLKASDAAAVTAASKGVVVADERKLAKLFTDWHEDEGTDRRQARNYARRLIGRIKAEARP